MVISMEVYCVYMIKTNGWLNKILSLLEKITGIDTTQAAGKMIDTKKSAEEIKKHFASKGWEVTHIDRHDSAIAKNFWLMPDKIETL